MKTLKNKIHWKTLFNKVAGLKPVTLLKKRLWHRFFPVNFEKFLRTHFLTEHLGWLHLELFLECQPIWYSNRNTIFSRINIIFYSDARNVTFNRGWFRVQNKAVTNFCKIDAIYSTVIVLIFVVIIMIIVVVIIIIVNVAITFGDWSMIISLLLVISLTLFCYHLHWSSLLSLSLLIYVSL